MKILKRLMHFAVPYWKVYVGALFLVLSISGMGLVQPMITRWVIDDILAGERYGLLLHAALVMVGAVIITGCLQYLQRYSMAYVGHKVIYDIRNRIYRHLQQLSYSFFDKAQTGQLMSRVTADVQTVQRFLTHAVISISGALFSVVATFTLMAKLHTKLTLVALVTVPLIIWRVRVFSTIIRPMFWRIQEQLAVLTTTLQENITGQRVVKAFARKDHETEKYERDNEALFDRNIQTVRLSAYNNVLMNLFTEGSLAIILLYGGLEAIKGNLSVGSLVAFNTLLLRLIGPIRWMGHWVSLAQRSIASGERIFEILDTRAEVADEPGAKPIRKIEGRVTFENVSFSYDGRTLVLEDINLDVQPGETIAILGGTGSGKSTLINLIPRFYDCTRGRVLIDGVDISEVTMESIRRQIGIVTQETFLFSASLKENIAYGNPHATDRQIRMAAKAAHIDEFISGLPNGYETVIGERGVGLSGGQKQRVAIARAILMDARILLLDESTSSVDVDTEMKIQEAFNKLLKDRTAFIIAQRLSTIRNADRIIILDKGKIVEEGTHQELLEKGGIYTSIYDLQFRSQESGLEEGGSMS